MSRLRPWLYAIGACALCCGGCTGLIFLLPDPPFEDSLEAHFRETGAPGVSILVARDGKPVYRQAYGYADLEAKIPMQVDSVHELASVSKMFTAAAVLDLADRGRLKLDDPAAKWFPALKDEWEGLQVRHLLYHTGGLPDYLERIRLDREYSTDQLIAQLDKRPLRFAPGSRFEYSNSGYMVLGAIVERLVRKPVAEHIVARFGKPLGLATLRPNDPTLRAPEIARGYSKRAEKVVPEDATSRSLSVTGDGCLMGSAPDLVAWEHALRTGKVLQAGSRAALFAPGPHPMSPDDPDTRYAMGWVVGKDGDRVVMNHAGGWMGTSTLIHREPETKLCIVVLTNGDFADASSYLPLLLSRFRDRP